VAERFKAPVLKTGDGQPSVSSNLTASATHLVFATHPFGAAMIRLLLIALIAFCTAGCATYQTISNAEVGSPKVFSGTRMNLAAMRGDETALRRLPGTAPRRPALDLPLSLVLDAALLQMTVPVALYEVVFE
jgi:uncharacterized protein YceK